MPLESHCLVRQLVGISRSQCEQWTRSRLEVARPLKKNMCRCVSQLVSGEPAVHQPCWTVRVATMIACVVWVWVTVAHGEYSEM